MVRRRIQLAGIALVLALAARIVGADIVQPVSLQLREQEPNTFLVQWSAPQTYPVRALPEPALPEDCRPQGERVLQEQPGTWLSRQVYRCQDVIAGRQIGVHYPFVTAGQSAMIRIELLSGEQLVHALNPGEDRWLVPEIDRGLTARLWSNLRRAVLDGVRHFLGAGLHFAFWLGLCLAAGTATGVRLVTGFSVGQILGVSLSTGFGLELAPALAEGGVAISTALLAAQALRTAEARRQLVALTLVAGLVHGLGVGSLLSSPASFAEAEWLYRILAVAGMDAALLVLVLLAAAMGTLTAGTVWPARLVKPFAYGLGGFAVAAALVLVFANPVAEAEANATRNRLPSLPGSEDSGAMP